MDKFNELPRTMKVLVILTGVLLIYSYWCRLFGIYFFWESKILGWSLVAVTIIGLLQLRIKAKEAQNKTTTSEHIATVMSVIGLIGLCAWFILIPQTDNYKIAEEYLLTDKSIFDELGEVNSIVLVPYGNISMSSSSKGTTGQENLHFIVKGKRRFKDINVHLYKEVNSDWIIAKPQ